MSWKTPMIDHRSGVDIYRALVKSVHDRTGVDADGEDPLAEAVLRIFSRYCELVIERLNKVPDKHHDAFLDILNISRTPPVPAAAALTFNPVRLPPKSAPVSVPARTKVAALPGKGENEPVVFETTRDLALTNVELKKIVALDPQSDLYGDKSALARREGGVAEPVFAAASPVAHEFYMGHDAIFGKAGISELRLRFDISEGTSRRNNIQWFIPAKDREVVLTPFEDTSEQLSRNGEIAFRNLPEWPLLEKFGRKGPWLGCRLLDRLQAAPAGRDALSRTARIKTVTISAAWDKKEGTIDAAFFNNIPLDLSKDFFPFGANPRFGDVFHIKSESFSVPGARVTLDMKLTNPASAGEKAPIPAVSGKGEPATAWESWNGRRWEPLECKDETGALTENGSISFLVPTPAPRTTVNGVEGCWLRARLVYGSYVSESAEQAAPLPAPPSIQAVTVESSSGAGPAAPESVVTNNNLSFGKLSGSSPFSPFQPAAEPRRALYLGFGSPDEGRGDFTDRSLDIYFNIGGPAGRGFVRNGLPGKPPTLSWQYWNGKSWADARVKDDTASLTGSGIVNVGYGDDIAPWAEFSLQPDKSSSGPGLHWLRMVWASGEYERPPILRRILLNTVPAAQTGTIENELLGSGTGRPNQVFNTARVPVLDELELEVREPEMPPAAELEKIRRKRESDALTVSRDPRGRIEQIWVRWREVADFLSSGNHDRDFVVERESGEIRFGDGIRGLIPPAGANNIRLRSYRIGGGTAGNKPPGGITQLRATVPYVDSVTNLDPSAGGQDIEAWESLRERGSRWLRHRDLAVTIEDYEDLSVAASSNVAMAKCYANRDLAADPAGKLMIPGIVSIVIVPHGGGPAPLPDPSLLCIVRDYLNGCKSPDAGVVLLAPEYVKVSLEIVIVPAVAHTGAGIAMQCEEKLNTFLHPVKGGAEGNGWDFGMLPRESDFYGLLESIRGLDYVRSLKVRLVEDRPGLLESGIFLICPGEFCILSDT